MYRGNPQYELYCFHQQNNGKTVKANEEQDFRFCGGSEKSRLKIFIKLFVRGRIELILLGSRSR